MAKKQCIDCLAGEHENYTDELCYVRITDPEDLTSPYRSGWFCYDHVQAYVDDGYEVRIIKVWSE
jgi:hypothetical protein